MNCQCPGLVKNEARNLALLQVIATGHKNDIPLFTWLTDTWSRASAAASTGSTAASPTRTGKSTRSFNS